jgi:hypothetical protein
MFVSKKKLLRVFFSLIDENNFFLRGEVSGAEYGPRPTVPSYSAGPWPTNIFNSLTYVQAHLWTLSLSLSVTMLAGSASEKKEGGRETRCFHEALLSRLKFSKKICYLFDSLCPSHHIKYTKRYMFGAVNVGKKLTNHTVLLYITSRIF